MEEKYCPSCEEHKPLGDFSRDRTKKDGLSSNCKKCRKVQSKRWSDRHPGRKKEVEIRCRQGVKKDPIRSAKRKAYNKEYGSKHYRRILYNLTDEQFLALLESQDHKCAMCGKPETVMGNNGSARSLAVDHDHTTGKLRGLLCFACNTNLGILENGALLDTAIPYLINYNSNSEIVSILQNIQQYLELKKLRDR